MPQLRHAVRALAGIALIALVATVRPGATAAYGAGLDLTALDPQCKACDDFYAFATGGWDAKNPVPADESRWGAFSVLQQQNQAVLREIIEAAAKDTAADPASEAGKVGAYYRTCTDEDAIERGGLGPLAETLAQIDAIATPADLLTEMRRLARIGDDDSVFSVMPYPDRADSSRIVPAISPAGYLLPDRDYYVTDDASAKAIRAAYVAYATQQFVNLGESAAAAAADASAVLAHETAIARAVPTRAELRNPAATWHPTPVADLAKLAPHVPWDALLTDANVTGTASVNVMLPAATAAADGLLASEPVAVWKSELRLALIHAYAGDLPKKFSDPDFAFFTKTLSGQAVRKPRWRTCVESVDAALGEAVGKLYVQRTFSPAAKARALALVNSLQSELRDDISGLDWMSPQTKAKALQKLDAFGKKIGYPDRWRDYSALTLSDDSLIRNDERIATWARARALAKIGKPADRTEWAMTPPEVNAYYTPINNEIVFPAGILQPPFFYADADDAVNYGAIGAVIGHEMTHGFDDQGRLFDANGAFSNWWTDADAANFNARAACIVKQYDALEVLPGVHQNGKLVQGEAIADLGGLTIAYRAFQKTAEYRAHQRIDGYTPEQRFFLAFARIWAANARDEAKKQLVSLDPHSDPRNRVLGTLRNMPEFAAAFACPKNAAMVRPAAERCSIW